jgi:hypothetical protein
MALYADPLPILFSYHLPPRRGSLSPPTHFIFIYFSFYRVSPFFLSPQVLLYDIIQD